MKTLLVLEEVAKLIVSYAASLYLGFSWWSFPAFLFLPDVSMAGYLLNPEAGAFIYNLFHHQAMAIVCILTGISFGSDSLLLTGLVLFGHSSMDRALGYGLKYGGSFRHTHLGRIGK